MKLKDGRITMLASKNGMTIELHDNEAAICFAEIKLNPVQLSQALSQLYHTKCKIDLLLSDRIGKKMENKTFEFEIPNDIGCGKNRKAVIIQTAKHKCPIGWTPDEEFSSQDSFFSKNGQHYAKTTIRRWV